MGIILNQHLVYFVYAGESKSLHIVLTPLYRNSKTIKSPKVVEIDLTIEKEPPHLAEEKIEKPQKVVHKKNKTRCP